MSLALTQLRNTQLQAIMISSLLLQRHTVLKANENFFPDIISDPTLKHTDIIDFAIKNANFKNIKEYFHFNNEVFYVDSLIENVELDVAINLATKVEKKYSEYSKEELIKKVVLHPEAVKMRNEDVSAIMRLTTPLRERKFVDYVNNITEVDFKEEISVIANNINRRIYKQDSNYYKIKASLIYNYVIDYLNDPSVQAMLQDDPYHITKYFLATTTSILMESLNYVEKGGLGIFEVGNSGKAVLPSIDIGLDNDTNTDTTTEARVVTRTNAENAIEDIDALLDSLKK